MWTLTNDGGIIGLFPETELLQLFHQILIHLTHHQWFTLIMTGETCKYITFIWHFAFFFCTQLMSQSLELWIHDSRQLTWPN